MNLNPNVDPVPTAIRSSEASTLLRVMSITVDTDLASFWCWAKILRDYGGRPLRASGVIPRDSSRRVGTGDSGPRVTTDRSYAAR